MIGLIAEFWPYIAGIGGAVLAALTVYMKGRTDANNNHKRKELERNHETRKRMDNIDLGGDDAEWLRKRAGKRGNL